MNYLQHDKHFATVTSRTWVGPPGSIIPLTLLSTEQQTVVLLPRSHSASKTYLPISVDRLEEEYRLRSADEGKLFREEYNVSTHCSAPPGPFALSCVLCMRFHECLRHKSSWFRRVLIILVGFCSGLTCVVVTCWFILICDSLEQM